MTTGATAIARHEFDGGMFLIRCRVFANFEAQPFHRICRQIESDWPGRGMPGCQQIGLELQDIGAVARAHQGFGGRRDVLPGMQWTATGRIALAGATGAGQLCGTHAAKSVVVDTLAAQGCDQLRQEAGQFAGHQCKIGIELLVGPLGAFLGFFLEQVEEGEALDLKLFSQHQ